MDKERDFEPKDESGFSEREIDKFVDKGPGAGLNTRGMNNILFSRRDKKIKKENLDKIV